MASKNVVRQDIVQVAYEVIKNPFNAIKRNMDDLKESIVGGVKTSDKSLDKLESGIKDVSKEAEDASNIFDKLKDKIGGLGIGGMVAGAAGGIGIAAMFSGANDSVRAMNQLQAQTGATAAEMKELGGMAKEVYANNMGENLDDVVRSMGIVKNVTGTSGEELKKLSSNALLLRDTFDFDVNESVRSADMLMKQFGISGDEAYNLIAQGAQLGLDKNGNLLDSFNEYSVHFKQLGLDSKDMMSIFANAAEQGVFDVDKIGDAVKEFGIRAKDGSKTTAEGFAAIGLDADTMASKIAAGGDSAKEAFQQTIEGLANMKDPVAREAAGVALMGTMWEDLGPKAVLAMDTTNKKVEEGGDALKAIGEIKYNDATSALTALGRTLNVEFADAATGAVGAVSEGIRSFTSGIKEASAFMKENWSWIKPTAIALAAYIGILGGYTMATNAAAIKTKLLGGSMLKSIGFIWKMNAAMLKNTAAILKSSAAMLLSPWTWVAIGIAAVVAGIVLLVKNWDTVKASLASVWQAFVQWISPLTGFVMSVFTGIRDFLAGIWQSIWSVIGGAVTSIWGVISTGFSYAFQIIAAIMQGIWSKVTAVWSSIVSIVGGFLSAYFGLVRSVWSAVFSFIGSILSKISGVVSKIWSSIVSKIGGYLGNIWTKVTGKFGELLTWLGGLKNKFLDVGSNLIKGLLDGITNKMGDLKKKVHEIGDNVLGGVKDFFGIASPSKEFELVGKYNVQGLEQGMERSLPSLRQTVSEVGKTTLGGNSGAYTPENSSVGTRGTTTQNNSYAPVFNLTINGGGDVRETERRVKMWVREAMAEMFDGIERKNPRLQEV